MDGLLVLNRRTAGLPLDDLCYQHTCEALCRAGAHDAAVGVLQQRMPVRPSRDFLDVIIRAHAMAGMAAKVMVPCHYSCMDFVCMENRVTCLCVTSGYRQYAPVRALRVPGFHSDEGAGASQLPSLIRRARRMGPLSSEALVALAWEANESDDIYRCAAKAYHTSSPSHVYILFNLYTHSCGLGCRSQPLCSFPQGGPLPDGAGW
jgi:hypothetical protein